MKITFLLHIQMRDVGSSRPKLRGLTTFNKFTSYRISCAATNLGHQPKDDRQLDEDTSFQKSSSIRPLDERVSISLCRCFILLSISLKANRVMQILRSRSSRLLTPEIVWLEGVSLRLVYFLDIVRTFNQRFSDRQQIVAILNLQACLNTIVPSSSTNPTASVKFLRRKSGLNFDGEPAVVETGMFVPNKSASV